MSEEVEDYEEKLLRQLNKLEGLSVDEEIKRIDAAWWFRKGFQAGSNAVVAQTINQLPDKLWFDYFSDDLDEYEEELTLG